MVSHFFASGICNYQDYYKLRRLVGICFMLEACDLLGTKRSQLAQSGRWGSGVRGADLPGTQFVIPSTTSSLNITSTPTLQPVSILCFMKGSHI